MTTSRSLAPLAAALLVLANASATAELGDSCVVDVERALAHAPKTADTTPLAEGDWIDDVYVMPYTLAETYDRQLPGGSDNVAARQWVSQSFFAHNPDAYDFIAVVTDFTFDAGWGAHGDPTHALYWSVRNDIAGIGLGFFDHSQLFGSRRLQGYIDANSLELVRDTEGVLDEDHFLTVVNHELGHRWLAHCDFEDAPGSSSSALLGVDGTHWSYLLDSDASYMYGAEWHDNGDGSFTSGEVKRRFSDLDLYLMGMLDDDEVEPFTLLDNPAVAPDQYPESGATVDATPILISVDQIIDAEGPRIPSAENARNDIRIAIIYLVAPGSQADAEELQFLAEIRHHWKQQFFAQTQGRGVIGVGRNSLPITSPPNVDLAGAVSWLLAASEGSGFWADHPVTTDRDTAAVIAALDAVGNHEIELSAALDALGSSSAGPTEVAAWRAEALARHQHIGADSVLDRLTALMLEEEAWGGGLRYAGDSASTARVARALGAGGRLSNAQQALSWLLDRQNGDGGWPWRNGGQSATGPTLEVIGAAVAIDPASWNLPEIQDAVTWLLTRRSQGGLGDPHPDVPQTALFLASATGQALDQGVFDEAIEFLAARQHHDGSWDGSVFKTAVAVAALAPHLQPDLAVFPSELIIDPEEPFIEDPVTLTAAVHSLRGDIAGGVPYRWEVLDANSAVVASRDGALPAIASTLFATITDTWDLRHHVSPGSYTFRITIDPSNEISESNEDNNTAELSVTFADHSGWIDLELEPDAVHANPPFVGSVPQTTRIDGVVRNTGHTTALDAVVAVFEAGSSTALAVTTVTVQGRGETAFQLDLQLDDARPYQLAVVADPDDLLNDADPSDNRVDLSLGVSPVFDPAIADGSLSVTPAAGIQAGDLVTISLDLVNRGTLPISNLQVGVAATFGDPATTQVIQVLEVSDPLAPGELRSLALEWRPPAADPAMIIAVEVDPSHLLEDADRGNNTDEVTVPVGPSPLPNLVASHTGITFDPEPALQNEVAHISAIVTNPTDNPAGTFTARLWIDEIGAGDLLGEVSIPGLAPGAEATVEADWLVDEMTDRLVWIEVDPSDDVAEFDEADNEDFRVLNVWSVPDLLVTSGQVSFEPRFPRTGDLVQVEIVVANTGDQSADNIGIELVEDGGPVIGTAEISGIESGDSATVVFEWPTDAVVGTVALRVTADPAGSIDELDETNNTVVLQVAVQDADLWVTERFISPNGDGVNDSTAIFVREGIDTIEVVDPWGEVVRTLAAEPPGATEWDGRRENGAAVRDGIYELRAGGLVSWVEVDLNGVTITDDIQQPLITGHVPTTSSHPAAEFTSFAAAPVDGIVYLTEFLGHAPGDFKVWRWNGEHLEDVPDWPDGHWNIRQISSAGNVFLTWSGDYSLIRFPGPQVETLPPPAYGYSPHLSPDGEWILWERPFSSWSDNLIVLQRTDDLGSTVQFGPFVGVDPASSRYENTVDYARDGSRVVVGAHVSNNDELVLDIDLAETPTVREVPLEDSCRSIQDFGSVQMVFAAVDFDDNLMICTNDQRRELYRIDLRTGATVETVALPFIEDATGTWYRLSNDGRAVEVDEFVLPWKNLAMTSPSLLDWQRGLTAPWFSSPYGNNLRIWSTRDRYSYSRIPSGGSPHFTYLTPAANLTVGLDPVVRFGGAGIDLFLTVSDKNLDFFQLEFAPADHPDAFEPLGQPVRDTFLGSSWGTWIPPAAGTWRIRLTATDLAGNTRSVAKWATWNGVADIAGLWTESRHISPVASPGVQDEMVWHYTVLRPSQLLFEIHDSSGALISSIPVGADETGPRTSIWGGLDDAGRPVPDGDYTLSFRGAEWPCTIDNTPPVIGFEIADNGLRPTADEIDTASNMNPPIELERSAYFNQSRWSVVDDNLDRSVFESRHMDQSTWSPVADGQLAGTGASDPEGEFIRSEWWSERMLRLAAADRAGNTSVAERFHREEQIAFAVAEPACRSDDEPCIFPDRPEINTIVDGDGLMDDPVAVLWPDYSTLLIQSTVWGDWRETLRLEFRVPAENGQPAGDWQPGTLTAADRPVWRRATVLTGSPLIPTRKLNAQVLPAFWEHPGLPLRPYEVRLLADNRDGNVVTGSTALVVPKAPLAVEYLSTDAAGDHFRVHNLSTETISAIGLLGSHDGVAWWPAVAVGSLGPGMSTLVSAGCGFHSAAVEGRIANWVRVEGRDPWDAVQSSLPSPFVRPGPPTALSSPSFTLIRGGCDASSPSPIGLMGYQPDIGGVRECSAWSCVLGWHSPGGLADLRMTVPDIDPNGTPIQGYELLIDGVVVAGAPDLVPGATGRVILDLSGFAEGAHSVTERYIFAPGDQGLLSSCTQSANLHIDRESTAVITSPAEGQALCPDQGLAPISIDGEDGPWEKSFTIDGSTDGIVIDPETERPAISVASLDPGPHTLAAEIVDLAGNAACPSVGFFTEGVAAPIDLSANPSVFSPINTTGKPTETIISFGTTALADFTIAVVDDWGETLAFSEGSVEPGATVSLLWDGSDLDGDPVADGDYGIRVRLVSECGAMYEPPDPLPTVTIDTRPPDLLVSNPVPGYWSLTAIELQALIADPHFESWEARIRPEPPLPGDWFVFASGDRPSTDPNNVLARWSTTHLPFGDYEIEVEAVDSPGNPAVAMIPIRIQDPELIALFDAEPVYISPNGDGAADATVFSFELAHEAETYLGLQDWIDLIDYEDLAAGTIHTAGWSGLDPDLQPVDDGVYSFTLEASSSSLEAFETESATVIVDTAPPTVLIASPPDGSLTSLPVTISGSSFDPHAEAHVVTLIHPDGATEELSAAPGDWPSGETFTFDDLPDGEYRARATATDLAQNAATVEHTFTIDATAPSAQITAPEAGMVVDPSTELLILRGLIAAAHPESCAWWIAEGVSPEIADFVLLDEQTPTAAGIVEFEWTGAPPADGQSTIRLTATDQLGRGAEDRRIVTIDSTPPIVELWTPAPGALVTEPSTITGRVEDENLAHWTLEEIAGGGWPRILAAGSASAENELIIWDPLPDDGPVTLRLSAHDLAGHVSETTVEVDVSVHPPGAPDGLAAQVIGRGDVVLTWSPGPGPAPAGYHVERDGIRITAATVVPPTYTDPGLMDGVYTYRVFAVGPHGRESEPSMPATASINLTPPEVTLTSPTSGNRIGGEVAIFGTAFASDDFAWWEIAARAAGAVEWSALDTGTAPVIGGFMTSWLTLLPPWSDGEHELRLAAEDIAGNRAESIVAVVIDNTAPEPGPVNLAAVLTSLDPDGLDDDVRLTWIQNPSPADLAGFYLYRNGRLANAPGPVVGDPSPYLLSGTDFDDRNVPDGIYTYQVAAADTAGNVSTLSNPAGPITIDTRRPHAVITAPADGAEIEFAVEVVAECADEDVVALDIQYRLDSEPGWTQLAPSFTGPPYVTIFTPPEHGLYLIRAVAADAGGPDPAPDVIEVTATDLPPEAPISLTGHADGDRVTLSWIAPSNPDGDLAGFDLERNGAVITSELIPPDTLVYADTGLADGVHTYRLFAVDQSDQRTASDPVSLPVRTPYWSWVPPVTSATSIDPSGAGAHALGAVEIQVFTPNDGTTTVHTIDADVDGLFDAEDIGLGPGSNVFTAHSIDPDGNTSRLSLPLVIAAGDPPSPIEDLRAEAAGSDVTLSWTSDELDTAGYRISRSGAVINETTEGWLYDPANHTLEGSGGDPSTWPLAVDGDQGTGWSPEALPSAGRPEWWAWTWSEAVELGEVTVAWSASTPPQLFDLDVLTPEGWLWLSRESWDGQPVFVVPAEITANGVRVRLPATGLCGTAACLPELMEIGLLRNQRTLDQSFVDPGLTDGVYEYEIRERNRRGQWSPSSATSVVVGPGQPLPPTGLTVLPIDCGGLELQWQPTGGQPGTLFAYGIYSAATADGPFLYLTTRPASSPTFIHSAAPVGVERFYAVTSRVAIDGVAVESSVSAPASGTAECVDPPPPVITDPTTAGHPIVISPGDVPITIRGHAVSGSVITLLHDGTPVATKNGYQNFFFADVDLHAGINDFAVRQELLGSIVDSLPIEIELDPDLVPDAEAVAVTVNPVAAEPGELVMVEGVVALHAATDQQQAIDAAFELTDPTGLVTEVYRTTLSIAGGETASVRAPWTAADAPGLYHWRFVIDPDDEIIEFDESNNAVEAQARVLTGAGLEISVEIGSASYLVGQQLTGTVFFASSEPPEDYLLETRIEDSSGRVAAVVDSRILTAFGGDWVELDLNHALVGLYPGLYRVRTVASINGSSVVEAIAPFHLQQPVFLEATVSTDRTTYPVGTPVRIDGRIANLGPTVVDGLAATIGIIDENNGASVAQTQVSEIAIAAGGSAVVEWSWTTIAAAPGAYRATLFVADPSGGVLATADPFAFILVPGEIRLAARVELSPTVAEPGDQVTAAVAVENTGLVDLTDVNLTIALIDPIAPEVVDEHQHLISLMAGGEHLIDQLLDTVGLAIQRYVVLVTASGEDDRGPFSATLGSASLEITDLSPPDIVVIEPATGGVACEEIVIEAEVTDTYSRIDHVSHLLDDDVVPIPLHLDDPFADPNRYRVTRPLPSGEDGEHRVTVFAEDAAGNSSTGVEVVFDTDTAAPTLQVTGPADGSCSQPGVSFAVSATDAHLASVTALLDGLPYSSGSVIALDGAHLLEVAVEDACGRAAAESRAVIIDGTAPDITVTGVAPGSQVPPGTVLEWSVVDPNLTSTAATLDGVPVTSPITLDVNGDHVLTVVGADCAGNTAETTVSFTVGEAVLAVTGTIVATPALLEPGQPMAVTGEIVNGGSDLIGVELILEVVRTASSLVVASRSEIVDLGSGQSASIQLSPDTSGWDLGQYNITFTARGLFLGQPFDLALGSSAVALADLTPPDLLVVSPVAGLACGTVQVSVESADALTGVSSVSVAVDGGPSQPLIHTGGSTWSTELSLDQGLHQLAVTASDGGGNTSPPIAIEIDVDTEAPQLDVSAPENGVCSADAAVIEFSAEDPHLESTEARLDGSPITSGHTVETDGEHTLEVTATDACGLQAIDSRVFIIDTNPPEITVAGPAEDEVHVVGVNGSWSAADDNLVSATATFNGEPVDPEFTVGAIGVQTLEITAEDCAENHAEVSIVFETVAAVDGLAGALTGDPLVLEPPAVLQSGAIVSNVVNTDYPDVVIRLEIIELASGAVVGAYETTSNLAAGSEVAIDHGFATDGLDLSEHELRCVASGTVFGLPFTTELDSLSFEVVDLTAPSLLLTSPQPGLACTPVEIRAAATDGLSGVASVEASIDADPTALPLTHLGGDVWTIGLSLADGDHHLEVTAADSSGNRSEPAVVDIDLDLTAPVLTVSAPTDGECRSRPATINFDAEDDHIDRTVGRLDGSPIASGHVVSADGQYRLIIEAEDLCGRTDTHDSGFVIDTTPPSITITGVADGDDIVAPAEISWQIDDPNLTATRATLDDEPVETPLWIDEPGGHHLAIEAEDCAGNLGRIEIDFTVAGNPGEDLVVLPPAFTAGPSVLLLDRSPAGGAALAAWFAERVHHVTRVTGGCAFIAELRRQRHDIVALYAPTGAIPLDFASCTEVASFEHLTDELGASAYRHGGILVLGDGLSGDGCLGCILHATGSEHGDRVVERLDVHGVTGIMDPSADTTIFDVRPLTPFASFPLLVGDDGGEPLCNGMSSVTLEYPDVFEDFPGFADVTSATPHQMLDLESGFFDAEDTVDATTPPWVDLAISRRGDSLEINLRTVLGGALPDWLLVNATVWIDTWRYGASAWLPTRCGLQPGDVVDRLEVIDVEPIGHDEDQLVAASARRHGRAKVLVLPWDVLAPPNAALLPQLDGALRFVEPDDAWPAVAGLPLPVSVRVTNNGSRPARTRLEALIPSDMLLEAWDEPSNLDPVQWEIEIPPGTTATRTAWLLADAPTTVTIPVSVAVPDGDGWRSIQEHTLVVEFGNGDLRAAARRLTTAIGDCVTAAEDEEIRAILRDAVVTVETLPESGDHAVEALRELALVFAATENEACPCMAEVRERVADLMALWQARWVTHGDIR